MTVTIIARKGRLLYSFLLEAVIVWFGLVALDCLLGHLCEGFKNDKKQQQLKLRKMHSPKEEWR